MLLILKASGVCIRERAAVCEWLSIFGSMNCARMLEALCADDRVSMRIHRKSRASVPSFAFGGFLSTGM